MKRHVPEGWLPARARPLPPPPPHRVAQLPYIQQAQDWISRNRAITAAIVAFVGTGGFLLWRERRKYNRKRRARRATNGARTEVVGMRTTLLSLGCWTDDLQLLLALRIRPSRDRYLLTWSGVGSSSTSYAQPSTKNNRSLANHDQMCVRCIWTWWIHSAHKKPSSASTKRSPDRTLPLKKPGHTI